MNASKIERLYLKNKENMLKTALRTTDDYQLAEDAVHQAIEKAIRIVDKIDESDEIRAGGLMCLMAKQAATELYHKKKGSIGEQISEEEMETKAEKTDISEVILQKDAVKNLRHALKWLPQNQLDVVLLKFGYDLSNDQIAYLLDIETNNVYIRIHRAKQKIKKYLLEGGKLDG